MATKNTSHTMGMVVLGTSLAGIAATAYFFLGPKGKKHQQHAKAWAIKMKGDVIEKLEKAKEITLPVYNEIIDSVAKDYAKGAKASKAEIEAIAVDLKKHWRTISNTAKATKREVVKDATRIAAAAR